MDDRRRDGGTNSTLRTKEQGTHLTLNEHDDDDDDDDALYCIRNALKVLECGSGEGWRRPDGPIV